MAAKVKKSRSATLSSKKTVKTRYSYVRRDYYYLTDRIIVFDYPRNDDELQEIVDLLEAKHKGFYLVFNFCQAKYNYDLIPEPVVEYPIHIDQPPAFSVILSFVQQAERWLEANPNNIIAINCRGPLLQRSGVMACCLLMKIGHCATGNEAMQLFAQRIHPLENPSHIRYIRYFAKSMLGVFSSEDNQRFLHINRIVINAVPKYNIFGGCEPKFSIFQNNRRLYFSKSLGFTRGKKAITFQCRDVSVSADIRVEFYHRKQSNMMFCFTLNTLCEPTILLSNRLTLQKRDLDKACTDAKHFHATFKVDIYFRDVVNIHRDRAATVDASVYDSTGSKKSRRTRAIKENWQADSPARRASITSGAYPSAPHLAPNKAPSGRSTQPKPKLDNSRRVRRSVSNVESYHRSHSKKSRWDALVRAFSKKPKAKTSICAFCKGAIYTTDMSLAVAPGMLAHWDCLKCHKCGSTLHGEEHILVSAGGATCSRCECGFFLKCPVCRKKVLTDSCGAFGDIRWHADCMKCVVCDASLYMNEYKVQQGRLHCLNCACTTGRTNDDEKDHTLTPSQEELLFTIYDNLARDFFYKFLKRTWCDENLAFYEDVEKYKDLWSHPKRRIQKAKNICAMYISQGSPRQVNIDDEHRQFIAEALIGQEKELEIEFFSVAQSRVFNLLDLDSFPKYLHSQEYRDYLLAVKKVSKKDDGLHIIQLTKAVAVDPDGRQRAATYDNSRKSNIVPETDPTDRSQTFAHLEVKRSSSMDRVSSKPKQRARQPRADRQSQASTSSEMFYKMLDKLELDVAAMPDTQTAGTSPSPVARQSAAVDLAMMSPKRASISKKPKIEEPVVKERLFQESRGKPAPIFADKSRVKPTSNYRKQATPISPKKPASNGPKNVLSGHVREASAANAFGICAGCSQMITTANAGHGYTTYDGKVYHARCFTMPICNICSKPIDTTRGHLNYSSGTYHSDCLRCNVCKRALHDERFVDRGNAFFCVSCWQEKLHKHCRICMTPIKGRFITYQGHTYHPTCFTCTSCSKQLGTSNFFLLNDKPVCPGCLKAARF